MKEVKCCGAITICNGQILMIKQSNGDVGFPKGHMETGETEKETAKREVKEETNVNIEVDESKRYEIVYPVNDTIKTVVYFIAKATQEVNLVNQESEIEETYLVNIEDVEDMITYENLKVIWRQAKTNF